MQYVSEKNKCNRKFTCFFQEFIFVSKGDM
jgi:hypothetical protein